MGVNEILNAMPPFYLFQFFRVKTVLFLPINPDAECQQAITPCLSVERTVRNGHKILQRSGGWFDKPGWVDEEQDIGTGG